MLGFNKSYQNRFKASTVKPKINNIGRIEKVQSKKKIKKRKIKRSKKKSNGF